MQELMPAQGNPYQQRLMPQPDVKSSNEEDDDSSSLSNSASESDLEKPQQMK